MEVICKECGEINSLADLETFIGLFFNYIPKDEMLKAKEKSKELDIPIDFEHDFGAILGGNAVLKVTFDGRQ